MGPLLLRMALSLCCIPLLGLILIGAYKLQRGYNRLAGLSGGDLIKRAGLAAVLLWLLDCLALFLAYLMYIFMGWSPTYMIIGTWLFVCGPAAGFSMVLLFDLDSLGAGFGMLIMCLLIPLMAMLIASWLFPETSQRLFLY